MRTSGERTTQLPDFPPYFISKWVRGGTVATADLVAELRQYADFFEMGPVKYAETVAEVQS